MVSASTCDFWRILGSYRRLRVFRSSGSIAADCALIVRTRATSFVLLTRDIVVIGASVGGIEAITTILKGLPSGLGAAIFVVVHIRPQSPSHLPEIFSQCGPLSARNARDGEIFGNGEIYVAPPDHHLILEASGRVRTTR